jgi:hypothetical protein
MESKLNFIELKFNSYFVVIIIGEYLKNKESLSICNASQYDSFIAWKARIRTDVS